MVHFTLGFLKLILFSIVTNKVFSVILFAYMEGLAASVEVSRARPPESPVSLYSSDLIAIISDESPDRLVACSAIDSQLQKKSGKTEGYKRPSRSRIH